MFMALQICIEYGLWKLCNRVPYWKTGIFLLVAKANMLPSNIKFGLVFFAIASK